MTDARYQALDAWVDAHFDEQVRFLQALVQVPTDTPPGNNAPHAARTAELLAAMGLQAECHAVPAAEVKAACAALPQALLLPPPTHPAAHAHKRPRAAWWRRRS